MVAFLARPAVRVATSSLRRASCKHQSDPPYREARQAVEWDVAGFVGTTGTSECAKKPHKRHLEARATF